MGTGTRRTYNAPVGPDLASERCLPCEQGTPPLSGAEAQALLSELDTRCHLAEDGRALTRQVTFKTFARAMACGLRVHVI